MAEYLEGYGLAGFEGHCLWYIAWGEREVFLYFVVYLYIALLHESLFKISTLP